jgi:carbon monoxide dehydrogenase subunit G
MKLNLEGVEQIQAPLESVRDFVTDPNQVGRCMPDLQELAVVDDRHMVAMVKIGVGPIKGTFKMEIELLPDGEQLGMKLKGSGMGNGIAMTSTMRLEATEVAGTSLHWTAEATVSGPLAGVGGRLLQGQAKKTTEQLFTNIREAVQGQQAKG